MQFGVVCLKRCTRGGTRLDIDSRLVVFFGERRRARTSSPDNITGASRLHWSLRVTHSGGDAFRLGRRAVLDAQPINPFTAMFSTLIRRVTPSLRQQALPRTAAAAYTQAAAAAAAAAASSSPSKLDEGEQAIYDRLSERFQPSELLVQDVSGTPPLLPASLCIHFLYSRNRWLWDVLCYYYCEQGI